jgi:Protein of unknown function DUF58
MQSLLSGYWNKWQFPSRSREAPKGGLKALRLPIFGRQTAPTLWLEPRFLVSLLFVPVLYIFAGETLNLWYYFLAGAVVAAFVLGMIIPMIAVLDTEATCTLPPHAVCKERVPLKVVLNRRGFFGPFAFLFPIKWLMVKIYLKTNDTRPCTLQPIIVSDLVDELYVFATTPALKRGVYRLAAIEVFSCFPFGMCWWSRKSLPVRDENLSTPTLTVYPEMEMMEGNFLYRIRAATDAPIGLLVSRMSSRAPTTSVKGIREFVHGDSPRIVHWASSARCGKLLVRDFEAEGVPGFDVLLNLKADWKTEEQFELAVSLTHSLIHLGHRVGLLPDFMVLPDLDTEAYQLPAFMADMPAVPSGLARSAELLARVEPLQIEEFDDEQIPQLREDSRLALLTVRPADPDHGSTDCDPDTAVELAVIPRTLSAASGIVQNVHMPLHEHGIVNRRQPGGNPLGRVISLVHGSEDIAQL